MHKLKKIYDLVIKILMIPIFIFDKVSELIGWVIKYCVFPLIILSGIIGGILGVIIFFERGSHHQLIKGKYGVMISLKCKEAFYQVKKINGQQIPRKINLFLSYDPKVKEVGKYIKSSNTDKLNTSNFYKFEGKYQIYEINRTSLDIKTFAKSDGKYLDKTSCKEISEKEFSETHKKYKKKNSKKF